MFAGLCRLGLQGFRDRPDFRIVIAITPDQRFLIEEIDRAVEVTLDPNGNLKGTALGVSRS